MSEIQLRLSARSKDLRSVTDSFQCVSSKLGKDSFIRDFRDLLVYFLYFTLFEIAVIVRIAAC